MNKHLVTISLGLALLVATPALGQKAETAAPEPSISLEELLKKVKAGWRKESAELRAREARFVAAKDKQKKLLAEALATKAKEEKRGSALERTFEDNENRIAELEETLRSRLGTMGEVFGVIRQVAGDTRGHIQVSLVSAQLVGRQKSLKVLAESKALPSIKQLEHLWYILQQEAIESGRVARFEATVVKPDGTESEKEVVRVGLFNAVADGKYLHWLADVQKLAELGRQPSGRYLSTIEDLEEETEGYVRVAVDPSRGQILGMLVQTASVGEQLAFGGLIGYIIIILGSVAFVFGMTRVAHLVRVTGRVRVQQRNPETPNANNPLGRVLAVYAENRTLDTATLELKLDEVIVREQSVLERFLWAIKVVSVVAPLMGLLGTVTGMIRTFQDITLFGAGDPKLMASGISQALITTMLGLIAAIPLVLLHSWLKSMSRRVMDVLGEQSTGMIATQAEKENAGGVAG